MINDDDSVPQEHLLLDVAESVGELRTGFQRLYINHDGIDDFVNFIRQSVYDYIVNGEYEVERSRADFIVNILSGFDSPNINVSTFDELEQLVSVYFEDLVQLLKNMGLYERVAFEFDFLAPVSDYDVLIRRS